MEKFILLILAVTISGHLFGQNNPITFDPGGGAGSDLFGIKATETGNNTTKLHIYRNFTFDTQDVDRLVIDANGKVGIGIGSPTANLHVFGANAGIGNTLSSIMVGKNNGPELQAIQESGDDDVQSLAFRVKSSATNADSNFEALRIKYDGNIGVGTVNPTQKFEVFNPNPYNPNMESQSQDHISLYSNDPGNGNYFGGISWKSGTRRRASIVATRENDDTDFVGIAFFTKGTDGPGPMYESMRIDHGGNVGIGISNPTEKLQVAGTVYSTEVKVEIAAGQGPDYVFEPDYRLRTLHETQEYISENKHLPEIPSAKEMEAGGVDLGDMNMRLLKKIEELTLYQIELLERLEKLETENERIDLLEKKVKQLANKNPK